MTTTTTRSVSLEHPYKVPGALLVILSSILIAVDIGYFETCGNNTGICLDWGMHRVGTSALVGFFIMFMIGIVLIVYTGESTTTASRTTSSPPAAPPQNPSVVVVSPSSQPAPPQTTVNVSPPRQSA